MKYNVGLDIGTGSVGWAVIDDNYQVLEARNQKMMGVRLFDSADTAAERRSYRTTRRRLSRRRWRIRLLNEIFESELSKLDENFLKRLKYSWVHPLDEKNRNFYYGGAIFGTSQGDRDFYQKYPTIYHLRKALMEDEQQHDLREIYIAIHHIIKYRGHFLTEGTINSEKTFDISELVKLLNEFNNQFYPDGAIFEVTDSAKVNQGLQDFNKSKSQRVEEAMTGFEVDKKNSVILKKILMGIVGNTVDLVKILSKDVEKEEQKNYRFKFSDENLDEILEKMSSVLTEEEYQFLEGMHSCYDGLLLRSILLDHKSISEAMVTRYEDHRRDLKLLKKNFRNVKTKKEFDEAYRNVLSHDEKLRMKGKNYFHKLIANQICEEISLDSEIEKVITNEKAREEDLQSAILKLKETSDNPLLDLLSNLNLDNFLPTQRNKSNGVIPHQLHENELKKIIENQSKYYPFLSEDDKIVDLFRFRVPYYVGPLVEKEKVEGDATNHWMKRKSDEAITPWNLEKVVDTDESAKEFIKRMTIKDTYLINEDTIPQNSPIYQKFTVLQELNNVRFTLKGDTRRHRLPVNLKQKIFNNVFKEHSNVTKKMVEEFILANEGNQVELSGLAGKNKFNNSLKTYNYLVSKLGRDFVEDSKNQQLLEEIVEIQTIFEDRKLIKRQLSKLEGLTDDQAKKLSNKHYTGWGRLSNKFLTAKKIYTKLPCESVKNNYSIMDLLYWTRLNLMEIINDPDLKVNDWIAKENEDGTGKNNIYHEIDDLAGAPEIKRGIHQSFRVLDDIKKALGGQAPANVFLEFARETQPSKVTNSRINRLKELYNNKEIKDDFSEISAQLAKEDKDTIKDDRLYLYYLQLGRDMYTGKPISIENISISYDIDHIIPQAYTKNNSLNNRVLVNRVFNARKSDSATYVPEVIEKMRSFWSRLLKLNLISQEKFNLLTRKNDFDEMQKKRFIARSLVETRQIIKNVAGLIEQHYGEETKAVAIRASLTGDMRKYTHKPKNRDINDYHHAHDALLIATVGVYIERRGFDANGEFTYEAFNRYTKKWLKEQREEGKDKERIDPFGFVVGTMKSQSALKQTNRETGEIVWNEDNYRYLLKQLEERDILFTRRVADSKGRLYKETRFPSKLHDPKTKGKQQFNNRQSVELYGGFDSIQLAYSVLIYHKKKFRLVGVRRLWLAEMKKDPEFLKRKVEELAPGAKIILDHIPSEQEIIKNGARMTIGSATELHNAEQLYLERDIYNDLSIVLKADTEEKANVRLSRDKTAQEALIEGFDAIAEGMKESFPSYKNYLLKMVEYRTEFEGLPYDERKSVLIDVLKGLHADATSKKLPFASEFGRFHPKPSVTFNNEDAFVFNSPTGIFRRVVKIKDLPGVADLE